MTLLEAVIAFVLLAVVGVVCLDQSRGASQLQASSAEWDRAVALGESALAAASNGDADAANASTIRVAGDSMSTGASTVRVARRPWRGDIDVIEVTVEMPSGKTFSMSRLTARAGSRVTSRESTKNVPNAMGVAQ